MTELNILLNFIIIFLLVTAIIYGFVLNRRIKLIKDSGRELANLFRSFDDTILRAETGVDNLKKISLSISEALQKKIDKGLLVVDDIELLNKMADTAASRLIKTIESYKKYTQNAAANDLASPGSRAGSIAAMPLVTNPPARSGNTQVSAVANAQIPTRNSLINAIQKNNFPSGPAKPALVEKETLAKQKKRALEDLLAEISGMTDRIQSKPTEQISNQANNNQTNDSNENIANVDAQNIKKRSTIIRALQALGYGE